MLKKILFGFLWFVVIYFVACFVAGAVAGAQAGAANPQHAAEAGRAAGAAVVAKYRLLLVLASAALAVLGSWKGILPGTKARATSEA